jgi:hypothetical protein
VPSDGIVVDAPALSGHAQSPGRVEYLALQQFRP